jgi:hypothetical protein
MSNTEIIKDIPFKIITNGIEETKELVVGISSPHTDSLITHLIQLKDNNKFEFLCYIEINENYFQILKKENGLHLNFSQFPGWFASF